MLIKNIIEEKIKNLSKPRKTLPQKMVQGGAFISSLKIIQKVLSLIRLVVIGRILDPSDFGLTVKRILVKYASKLKKHQASILIKFRNDN